MKRPQLLMLNTSTFWKKHTKLNYRKIRNELAKQEARRCEAGNSFSTPLTCIVFSRDRPLQLHGLLRSLKFQTYPDIKTHVIFRCSSEKIESAYMALQDELQSAGFDHIHFQPERGGSFKTVTRQLIQGIDSEKLLFLVDDDVFIAPVDLFKFAADCDTKTVGSLRLGQNLDWCYPKNSPQGLPRFIDLDPGIPLQRRAGYLSWFWTQGEHDWGYPLSLDGHLFNTADIQIIVKYTDFHSPNTLEANIQPVTNLLKTHKGLAFSASRLFNIPVNRVQQDKNNRFGELHQDLLLEYWEQGYQMKLSVLDGLNIRSAHQEIDIEFEKRSVSRSRGRATP